MGRKKEKLLRRISLSMEEFVMRRYQPNTVPRHGGAQALSVSAPRHLSSLQDQDKSHLAICLSESRARVR